MSTVDSQALLSLQRIFATDDFQEEKTGSVVWSKQGTSYFTFSRVTEENEPPDFVRVDARTGTETVVLTGKAFIPSGESKAIKVDGFSFSADESKLLIYANSQRVWRLNTRGDYWVLDIATQQLKKLGGDAAPSTLMFAKFSPKGERVSFVRENNIYVQNLRDMQIIPLTKDGNARLIYGTADWVNEEELQIRDGYRWNPDGNSIAFWCFDTHGVEEFHLLDNTAGTYPRLISFPYPKVGQKNSSTKIGVVSVSDQLLRWVDLPGDPREHYVPQLDWTPDGQNLLIQQMNRLQNTNRVMTWNAKTGEIRPVLVESDDTWLENENPVRWINGGQDIIWLSERTGWRHIYRVSLGGSKPVSITQGKFDVLSIEAIDELNGWLYFSASPDNPTQRYLFRTSLNGGDPVRLTPVSLSGWNTYEFSPDSNWAFHKHSRFESPPTVTLIQVKDHSVVRTVIDNSQLRKRIDQLHRPKVDFFRVDIGGDLMLDGWCMKPPINVAGTKFPILFYVYGEPHGQTVRDAWQGTRGLWHCMLAQQGYVVASVDNRGTNSPRGRDWRKCVYKQIGILAAEEQAVAVRTLLQKWSFVDSGRVGVWGWSGGGSMSLNAIFRFPDLYHSAIAVAPNANQLLYDTIYQERYMGLPEENEEGYRKGSPITYANQLRGNLLLVHGTGDDNGHFQGTEMLMNELIAHNKRFAVMPYPGRSHAISEGKNTVLHFHSVLTDFLDQHLKASKTE